MNYRRTPFRLISRDISATAPASAMPSAFSGMIAPPRHLSNIYEINIKHRSPANARHDVKRHRFDAAHHAILR